MGEGRKGHQARAQLSVDANMFPRVSIETRLGPVSVRQSRAAGRPLVLLHGIGGNADAWRLQYGAFNTQFRVIGWDAPGYGDSFDFKTDAPSVEDYAGAFVALLDALGIERAVVVGHSLGGLVAACAAAQYGDRFESLVLTACSSGHASYDEERRQAILRTRLEAFANGDVSVYARSRVKNLLSAAPPAEVVEEAVSVMAQIRQPGFPQATRMVSASDIFPFLARIRMPARVICGTDDKVTPAEMNQKIAAGIAGADFVPIDGAGHWLFLEFSEQFNTALRQFVSEIR
jgi:pimeloyl-ACP methyl ester carboxylesterase